MRKKRFKIVVSKTRGIFLGAAVVGVIFSINSVLIPYMSGELINVAIKNISGVWLTILEFTGISVIQIILSTLDMFFSNELKIRQKSAMRQEVIKKYITRINAGKKEISEWLSFINVDLPAIAEQYVLGTIDLIKCATIVIVSAAALFFVHWGFALIILSISILIVVLPNVLRKRGGMARKAYSEVLGKYTTLLNSVFGGLNLINNFLCADFHIRRVADTDKVTVSKENQLLGYELIVQGITTLLQIGKKVIILLLGVLLISKHRIEVGSMLSVIALDGVISAPIEVFAFIRHSRNEIIPIVDTYNSIKEEKEAVKDKVIISNDIYRIYIDDLYFQVNGYSVLKSVNAEFLFGKKYLLIGESGSGKSTLLSLIGGMGNNDYKGEIFYNDLNLRDIEAASLHRNVSIVYQEPYLFYASLSENICLGRDISRERFDEVIHNLNLEYLFSRFTDKEITADDVEKLSGGEKQRVALARAMVGSPKIYLLDEITSSLDEENAEQIEKAILKENTTIIHVCHRFNENTINLYDEILELKDGVINRVNESHLMN